MAEPTAAGQAAKAAALAALTGDLLAETAVVEALLAPLDEAGWNQPTPAAGWSVKDQVTHLAFFDEVTQQSITDPDGFRREAAEIAALGPDFPDVIAARFRDRAGADVLAWLRRARAGLCAEYRAVDPGRRLPWFGPAMSPASSVTARIMETWAHGQDIADTFGAVREPTARLRHVAHIGVRALPFSYALNGKEPPQAPVRVELTAPGGELWTWGPPDAADRVTGPALDFCLLVTQRRHRDDTALVITGDHAREWTSFAQAFAGKAASGRAPGQFTTATGQEH